MSEIKQVEFIDNDQVRQIEVLSKRNAGLHPSFAIYGNIEGTAVYLVDEQGDVLKKITTAEGVQLNIQNS